MTLLFVLHGVSLQRQRLRELLIRQQMQRNSLRQEKEAAAANSGATTWPGETAGYQQDKSQRAPPPYPAVQVRIDIDRSELTNFAP